jgi:hypothetical protein
MNSYNLAGVICSVFACGAIGLAAIDSSSRVQFFDLAKIALGGYLGQLIPKDKEN